MNLPTLTSILFRVTPLDILFFTKHLSVMLKSGIPLAESIQTLKNQTKNLTLKNILTGIYTDVENGQSLETALSKHSAFSSLYVNLIAIGEKSGKLEESLEYLSLQLKKSYDFEKKIQGATLYPKLVLAATVIMASFISLFVLPNLVDLFKSLEVELPLGTKVLLFVADIMKKFGFLIVAALVIAGLLVSLLLKTPLIKPKWQKFVLSIPFVGSLNQNMEMASFCRNMGVMLKSGLTITESLKTQFNATDNLVFKGYLGGLSKSMEKGKKLSDELSSSKYKYIPAIVPKMIGVGESTGKLEDVFIYLGDFFEEDVDEVTKNLSNILEPLLLLVIGIVVAFVSLAIISPIYQLTGSIRK
ncbi:type II secretion system F family protein [Candidatus Daviesbacteria bacterium]|nr:type II secretion system F family protein [Candidatus Daviesbacteria bacterium]